MDDVNSESFSSPNPHLSSPKNHISRPSGSGLTLVIPSLKSLKASQSSAKKPKSQATAVSTPNSTIRDVEPQERKIPRPLKLKPLREVLSKLIAQIKKKDDYAFFLTPVDTSKVAGYTDLIKFPMDLGTMTDKVHRGKYRSLEDFSSDFKLVTMNAKIFNPPGSIYYIEADRLESWGIDHINRAAATVIQNETDWSIDIENDDEPEPVNVDRDDDEGNETPMDVDSSTLRERSVSVAPSQLQGSSRRPTRAQAKKPQTGPSNTLSEALDSNGGLPGSKDGLGAFPASSDWAKTMLALKLKGKRYKTKKERMRIERSGPPLLPDGSLDYTEMEDPFSVLSFFVPDSLSRPHLVPIYPPLYNPAQPRPRPLESAASAQGTSANTPQPQRAISVPIASQPPSFPSATSLQPDYTPPVLPSITSNLSTRSEASGNANKSQIPPRRRHWVVNRSSASRQKGKEKEDDQQEEVELALWQTPREAHAVDFGSFSALSSALSAEMQKRGITNSTVAAAGIGIHEAIDQEVTNDLIKDSLDSEAAINVKTKETDNDSQNGVPQELNATNLLTHGYWTDQRAIEAEEYLKDVVYGGVAGLAYVRSLAVFVDVPSTSRPQTSDDQGALSITLGQWIVNNMVDTLTDGRHSLLRETARELIRQHHIKPYNITMDPRRGTVPTQVTASLYLFPATLIALSSLLHIRLHKIDMGSLLKTPQELFVSEEEWVGKGLKEQRRLASVSVKQEPQSEKGVGGKAAPVSEHVSDAMEVEEPEQTWVAVDADVAKAKVNGNGRLTDYEVEGPEELREVLEYVADVIVEIDQKVRVERARVAASNKANGIPPLNGRIPEKNNATDNSIASSLRDRTPNTDYHSMDSTIATQTTPGAAPSSQAQQDLTPSEDPALRKLRLNLLALAKRAPLDTIARLPKDLVPEHIRHFVPTYGTSS